MERNSAYLPPGLDTKRYQNYCAVTVASEYQETDEDLVLREGLARLRDRFRRPRGSEL